MDKPTPWVVDDIRQPRAVGTQRVATLPARSLVLQVHDSQCWSAAKWESVGSSPFSVLHSTVRAHIHIILSQRTRASPSATAEIQCMSARCALVYSGRHWALGRSDGSVHRTQETVGAGAMPAAMVSLGAELISIPQLSQLQGLWLPPDDPSGGSCPSLSLTVYLSKA